MTHEKMIAVITARKEGKQIQYRRIGNTEWSDTSKPVWNFALYEYQIKPEPPKPIYIYFSDAEECFAEVKKHGGWVKCKHSHRRHFINGVDSASVAFCGSWMAFVELFDDYVWADDGTPCGIKEE